VFLIILNTKKVITVGHYGFGTLQQVRIQMGNTDIRQLITLISRKCVEKPENYCCVLSSIFPHEINIRLELKFPDEGTSLFSVA
jgi:hypothetical protein